MSKSIREQIEEGIRLRTDALEKADEIEAIARVVAQAFRDGKFLYVCGNGGSAADAQHLAAELSGRFYKDRDALPAIALTTNSSALTAIGNDYGYDDVFSRQLAGLARPGDIVIGISTSGNSGNVLKAAEVARKKGAIVIGLCGKSTGKLAAVADHVLAVESGDVARIQEIHLLYYHLLCFAVEKELFG